MRRGEDRRAREVRGSKTFWSGGHSPGTAIPAASLGSGKGTGQFPLCNHGLPLLCPGLLAGPAWPKKQD